MYVIERDTHKKHLVQIAAVEPNDYKKLTVKRYAFPWQKLKQEKHVYKLMLADEIDILGLIWLAEYPSEERLEIKLLAVSAENVGHHKQYERIAGCLIAFAGREAIRRFKNYPAISLIPKTELRKHYMDKYGMIDGGWQLYLEDLPLIQLIKKYSS